jgi:hypothetical protein
LCLVVQLAYFSSELIYETMNSSRRLLGLLLSRFIPSQGLYLHRTAQHANAFLLCHSIPRSHFSSGSTQPRGTSIRKFTVYSVGLWLIECNLPKRRITHIQVFFAINITLGPEPVLPGFCTLTFTAFRLITQDNIPAAIDQWRRRG